MSEATRAVGVTLPYFSQVMKWSPVAQEISAGVQLDVRRRIVDIGAVIEGLSHQAVMKVKELMDGAGKEDVQLRAAQDLLDRNPKTSKTRRIAVESLTLTGRDLKELMASLRSADGLEEQFASAADGNYIPAPENESDG